ncbi:F-box/FBD/LRR-repeat protein At1g13570-like isoform X3 [Panicum virgatum]|uniref:F-box/FBD/LRR-repeat protein At1g13570-like isoform X3 n=1 Tax=Panicum virgatum TaxID=38727 RepID=UPI0019D5DB25|nr:F-box/FBD/LRR-repeat protein At1g13570-like isoform X3 [Panicum virgatum]
MSPPLMQDVLCTILLELPLKDVVRSSVLSSKWRFVHKINPKFRFDGKTMCSANSKYGSEQYTQEFIRNVNTVLQQHKGDFVGHFEVRFDLSRELAIHLDNWVGFVVSSNVQNLAFDLVPAEFRGHNDRYLLPSKLLDSASTSCLQNVQLGFVSFKLPSQFSGFPNLRKLDLQFIDVTAKDLEDMLSSCSCIAWLSIVRRHLDDELKVDLPLPSLLYLSVAHCRVTGVKFNAMKLKSFNCRGSRYPIDLTQSLELKDAHLYFFDSVTLEYTLSTLPTVLPSVEYLYLRATATLKTHTLLENTCRFSQLKYLQLELYMVYEDADNILSLASILRAAPLLENFELHLAQANLSFCCTLWKMPLCWRF